MGMFDSVYVKCAHCEASIEFQSKEGDCELNSYTLDTAPAEVLRDVLNSPHYCAKCGHWSALYDPQFPPDYRPPRPSPTVVMVRDPQATEQHVHASQPFLRWWEAPFTASDIATHPPEESPNNQPRSSGVTK